MPLQYQIIFVPMIVRLIPWTVLTNPFLSCKPPYHMQDQSSVLINMLCVNQVCDYIVFKKIYNSFQSRLPRRISNECCCPKSKSLLLTGSTFLVSSQLLFFVIMCGRGRGGQCESESEQFYYDYYYLFYFVLLDIQLLRGEEWNPINPSTLYCLS